MQATPFNPQSDLAPMPFDERHCQMAQKLKETGLPWNPHVGCFVWDPDKQIQPESPFPCRIYFILNLNRFIDIFGSTRDMREKLVWLPTWHQTRQLCERHGVTEKEIAEQWHIDTGILPGDDLMVLYEILMKALKKNDIL